MTTEIKVVAKDEAEQVQMTSSPDLDQAMRAAFALGRPTPVAQYRSASGDRWIRGPAQIIYRISCRGGAHRHSPIPRRTEERGAGTYVARAGDSGNVNLPLWDLGLEQPGRYEATLVDAGSGCGLPGSGDQDRMERHARLPVSFDVDAKRRTTGLPCPRHLAMDEPVRTWVSDLNGRHLCRGPDSVSDVRMTWQLSHATPTPSAWRDLWQPACLTDSEGNGTASRTCTDALMG